MLHTSSLCCTLELQQPYNENKDKVIGQFLFSKLNLEKKKEVLFQMWKKRECQLKKTMETLEN